jgi:hypothetical protein
LIHFLQFVSQRLKLARTEQAELDRLTAEFSADRNLIQRALERWRQEEYSFISSARDKVEARLHGLLNPPSRSIVGEAARAVRDEWQQRGQLKIKVVGTFIYDYMVSTMY